MKCFACKSIRGTEMCVTSTFRDKGKGFISDGGGVKKNVTY